MALYRLHVGWFLISLSDVCLTDTYMSTGCILEYVRQ